MQNEAKLLQFLQKKFKIADTSRWSTFSRGQIFRVQKILHHEVWVILKTFSKTQKGLAMFCIWNSWKNPKTTKKIFLRHFFLLHKNVFFYELTPGSKTLTCTKEICDLKLFSASSNVWSTVMAKRVCHGAVYCRYCVNDLGVAGGA